MPGFSPYGGPRDFYSFGGAEDVDAADGFEDITLAGGTINYPTAAALAVEVVSSSTSDDAAGTGARTIRVVGLSATYQYVTQDVIMDGTTEVVLATALIRVWSVRVLTIGTDTTPPTGNIDIRLADNTVVFRLLAGIGGNTGGFFTAPEGAITRLVKYGFTIAGAAGVAADITGQLWIRRPNDAGGATTFFELIDELHLSQAGNPWGEHSFGNLVFPPRTDFKLSVDTDVDNTDVEGFMEFEMKEG